MPTRLTDVGWKSPPLFNYKASRRELLAQYGEPHEIDLDSNGVGLFDLWMWRYECGLEIAVWQFHRDARGNPVVSDEAPRIMEIHANERELLHLLFHLDLDVAAAEHWRPDPTYVGEARFEVVRQDDNGNEYVIDSFTSRCEAEAVATTFTERGHKQLYWVRERN